LTGGGGIVNPPCEQQRVGQPHRPQGEAGFALTRIMATRTPGSVIEAVPV
jgi:hypothetical protein